MGTAERRNDMARDVTSYGDLLASDAKLMRRVVMQVDCKTLQQDMNKTYEWNQAWESKFNQRN